MARKWRIGARAGALGAAAIPAALAGVAYVSGSARVVGPAPGEPTQGDETSPAGSAIGTDEHANVYVAGLESGGAVVAGQIGAVVTKLDADGARLWSHTCASSGALGEPRIAVGAEGDVALVLTFQGSIDCGNGRVMAEGGEGDFDALVVKLDAGGRVAWSRRLGDVGVQAVAAVAIDPWGSVVVAGSFEGTLALGGALLVAEGERDVLLAKLDAHGLPAWGKQLGLPGQSFGVDVDVARSGRILLLARGTAAAEGGSRGGPLPAATTSSYVAAFDPGGRPLWSRRLAGTGDVVAVGVKATSSNRVVVGGSFTGTADLGTGPLDSAGGSDVFVAKLDAAGDPMWSARFGDGDEQVALGIATGPGGRIAIAGKFNGTIDFGNGPLASRGGDMFVVKLDAGGRALWTLRGGQPLSGPGLGIAVDDGGHVLVTAGSLETMRLGQWSLARELAMDLFVSRVEQ